MSYDSRRLESASLAKILVPEPTLKLAEFCWLFDFLFLEQRTPRLSSNVCRQI